MEKVFYHLSPLSKSSQIDELNGHVKAKIAPSKIHGVGVFTLFSIRKGERLFCDRMPVVYSVPYGSFGKLFPEIRELILSYWPSVANGSKFISPDARLVSFMNHSETEENYDPKTDTALCDIPKGHEVFENYKRMANWEKVFLWLK